MNVSLLRIPLLILFVFLYMGTATAQPPETAFGIKWYSMKQAQEEASKTGKKIYLYSYAEWCTYCKKMENEVYPQEFVQETLGEFYYPVRVNIESDQPMTFNGDTLTGREFARKYRITATPTAFFIGSEGSILGTQPGFIPPDIFDALLSYVGSDAFKSYKFKEYMERTKKKDN